MENTNQQPTIEDQIHRLCKTITDQIGMDKANREILKGFEVTIRVRKIGHEKIGQMKMTFEEDS
jgi:hypothetical protein